MIYFCRHRWTRLFQQIGEAWHSFKYDVIVTPEEAARWGREAAFRRLQEEDYTPEKLESYRNCPLHRGFCIDYNHTVGRYVATDGRSTYWLNTTSKRWICMEGPDLYLPTDVNGDVNSDLEKTDIELLAIRPDQHLTLRLDDSSGLELPYVSEHIRQVHDEPPSWDDMPDDIKTFDKKGTFADKSGTFADDSNGFRP